ncbi:hypothetical protein [Rhizobium binxianense]
MLPFNASKGNGPAARLRGNAAGLGAADWLSLAAAPTFAAMALLTAAAGDGEMLCSSMPVLSPLGGMVPMYLLMSAFHLAPWLRLISRRETGSARS